jgi:peptidoglycan/LPS O-acetylase OafA/YrhL
VKPVLATGWFLCLALGLAIPFFREIQSNSVRLFANRIATYSYGIYVSHQFCIWFAMEKLAAQPMALRVGVLIVSLVAVPVLLFHGLEKPMIGIGVRLAARTREKTLVALPAAA